MLRRRRRAIAAVTAFVTAITLTTTVRPAPAFADAQSTALRDFLSGASNSIESWSQGLGQVGKLADALPAVQSSPGSALGFNDLLDKAFNKAGLDSATDDAGLTIDKDIDFGGGDGRSGHLKTTVTNDSEGKHLALDLHITRDVLDQPLNVPVPIGSGSNAPQSSFSSQGGVKLTVTADLKLEAVYQSSTGKVYLRVISSGTDATPSLTVGAKAVIGNVSGVEASVGILGVALVNDSSLDVEANFAATFSDPNNDGKLYFDNPDGTPGELAADGSLEGLVSVGFANPAGHLNASLHMTASANSSFSLPAVDATLTVSWPDISTGSPSISFPDASVGQFLNMTPRDLAIGIAQLVTSLASIQAAKSKTDKAWGNLDLPFIKGTLADAVQISESLKKFLGDWTYPGPNDPNFVQGVDDPAKAGEPKFTSLQKFIDKLNATLATTGGALSNVGFDNNDPASHKLHFTLALKHSAPSAAVDLNAAGAASSGPAGDTPSTTYAADKLVDDNQHWKTNEFAGRQVVAGTSGATIESNNATTLFLKKNQNGTYWTPTVPNANEPYSISGLQGDIGAVQLGNSLQTPDADSSKPGHGVANANAVNATAKVKPSFDASVTLVLDLQPPVLHDPPVVKSNPDGSTFLVSSEPTGADRVLVRTGNTPLFTADFPMDASADIFANAGFLQVELKGAVHVCQKDIASADCTGAPPAGKHMLEVDLKDKGDITFGDLVKMLLDDPKQLLDFKTGVRAVGSVKASIPAADTFFGGTQPEAGFHWNDLTVLDANNADGPKVDFSALSKLAKVDFDPSNPRALFSIILKTLQTLNKVVGSSPTTDPAKSIFNTQIPVLGRSLGQLLAADESGAGDGITFGANTLVDNSRSTAKGNAFTDGLVGRSVVVGTQAGIVKSVTENTLTFMGNWATKPSDGTSYVVRSQLDDAITILENAPSDNLQQLTALLNSRLGHNSPITFEYADGANVNNTPSIIIKLNWHRDYHTSAPIKFDFKLGSDDHSLAGVQGSGSVSLGVSGDITMGLVVGLAPGDGPGSGADLKILDNSGISLKLDAAANGSLTTTVGPLSIALGDPSQNAPADQKINAQAHYGLKLGKSSPSGNAESFDTFLGEVGPSVNSDTGNADCGFTGGTVDLAMCADLPLYVKGNGNTYTKLITDPNKQNDFKIRLPKQPQGGADVTDVINPLGSDIDGHKRIETPDPTDFANALSAAALDLTRIDGIDSFLNALQNALITASFGGKLPLIGDDIQQGADFIGKLKTQIDAALGDLATVNSTDSLRDWLNNKLKAGLQSGGFNPDAVTLDTTCNSTLGSVTPAPTVALVNAADAASTTYDYVVASYIKDSSNAIKQAKASDPGEITNGPDHKADGVSPSKPLKITWTAVSGAAGYLVFRKDGSDYKQIADVTGTEATDDGSATPGDAPANPASNPNLHNCNLDDFKSIIIRVDVSQGDFTGDYLKCDNPAPGHECLEEAMPLNIGLPGLSLRSNSSTDTLKFQLGWRLHLAFGIDKEQGFFVDTKDGDPQPEMAVGLNVTLPANIKAQLAIIDVDLSNCTKADATNCDTGIAPPQGNVPPLFGGSFKLDLTSPHNNGLLTLADLGTAEISEIVHPKLTAGVHIDWLLKATVDEGAGFPGIQTHFHLAWEWTNADPGSGADNGLDIQFAKVQISAGKILGQVIGPIIQQIKKVTDPLQPVIKTLYAPIPVLSDLSHLVGGDDVTLVSIAKAFSTIAGGPDLTFVDRVTQVIKIVSSLPVGDDDVLIPIGSFAITGSKAVDTTATPDNSESLIKTGSKALDSGVSGDKALLDKLDDKTTSGTKVLNTKDSDNKTASEKAGFSFPVFEKPASLFNLLLGGDVDLVKFDSGPLTLGFDWRQEFGPVYAPPPVMITLHGSASVTLHIVAGFDTYGIRKAIEKVRDGTFEAGDVGEAILQSLFFYTNDDAGKPIPVVQFNGEIAAGAAVSAVIITVGIEGGVGLTVSFLWNDPNHDGKFRISEFLKVALNNPICLFSVSGRVYVFLKLYVKIGFGPFSVSFSFTIVDVTLLDFSVTPNCDPPPPKLGGLGDGGKTLVVYAASLGGTAYRGDPAWDSASETKETIKITSLHDYTQPGNPFKGVAVEMLGIRNEFLNPNIERVIVDGHTYDKPMTVTFIGDGKEDTARTGAKPPTASFEKDAIVFGSSANDKIKTGIGNSYVDGGNGDDTIVTGDRTVAVQDQGTQKWSYVNPDAKAWVAGGDGNDSITVGNGDDRVSGDGHLGYTAVNVTGVKELKNSKNASENETSANPGVARADIPVPDWTKFTEPNGDETGLAKGNDVLSTGLGTGKVFGNGGDDTVSTTPDNDLVKTVGDDAAQKALFHSAGATLVGGTGNDNIAGAAGDDKLITGPDAGGLDTNPDANGGSDDGSTNIVDTGTGNDKVYGSTGVDRVTGRSRPDQVDNIRGGAGNDILIGGYGKDTVFGGPDDDYVIAEPSTVDIPGGVPPADSIYGPLLKVTHLALPDGTTPSSKTLVGGTGDDHIIGGDGGAAIDGDGYNPSDRCGSHAAGWATLSDPVDESVNTADDGNDKIIGGAGVENVRAGGGNDLADIKGADDLACGESGNDVLKGGNQDDTLWGGSGSDTEYGDSGADKVFGNAGGDFLYGGIGADTIEGNNGSDYASGGEDNDLVVGGTRLAGRADVADYLYGDNGQDTIVGDNVSFPSGVLRVEDLLAGNSALGGPDWIFGGNDEDSLYGGFDKDHVYGGAANDYIEGNNDVDTIFGEGGADNILGGSAQKISGATMPDAGDTISGGAQDDVILGDNGSITDAQDNDPVLDNRGLTRKRHVVLYDAGNSGTPDASRSGGDTINGDGETDAIFGEGDVDTIHGDSSGSTASFDDYVEGGQAGDNLFGDGGQDDLVGGSYNDEGSKVGDYDANDTISGGPDGDVVLGDNGLLTRLVANASKLTKNRANADGSGSALTLRSIDVYDQGDSPVAGTSGGDLITGDGGGDVILGQRGNDRIQGNDDSDYIEGDGGRDWIEGNSGNDDIVGGSTFVDGVPASQGQFDGADVVFGGNGDDMVLGDNAASVNRIDTPNPLTRRIDNAGAPIPLRAFTLLDLANGSGPGGAPTRAVYGGDLLSGGGGTDVILGQDGDDQISGGAHDDYAEGNAGHDTMWGDNLLTASLINDAKTAMSTGAPDGLPAGPEDRQDASDPNGQDDLMGGSSIKGFRDLADDIHGDGGADYEIGDNGTIVRDILDKNGVQLAADADLSAAAQPLSNRVYTKRYAPTLPLGAAYVRHSDPNLAPTTRFCTTDQTTCEPTGAFGNDNIWGDSGDDTLYGQDGNDLMYGDNGATAAAGDGDPTATAGVDSSNDDDMYGELGNDRLWGESGSDAMLGDRGGVVDQYEDGSRNYSIDVNQVPKVHYEGFIAGTVTRQTDLQHDVNGDVWVGASGDAKMPHPGDVEGGDDRLRGGVDEDFLHAGFGDDLANGDSGGDTVFGDDGADVLWGGKGCDQQVDTLATTPDCYNLPGNAFNPNARGTKDRMVDYLLGGKGAYAGPSVDPASGDFGSDILDWHPRGTYATGSQVDKATTCGSKPWPETFGNGSKKNPLITVDPCSWFEMTNLDDGDNANTVNNNQHHQGIDWMYGGWDRDVLQGDVADNGPNAGDRLLDWNGTYNLYTHCNSAYGGYNDVRQHSPDWQAFLQKWVFSIGAGQIASDASTGSVGVGPSAFDELALVYPGADNDHGSGNAFPSTPGHFDNPNACAP